MKIDMETDDVSVLSKSKNTEFVVEGQDAIILKFVRSPDQMESAPGYHPEFVHQHFGDKETIFGYKNLEIILYYSDASIYIYPEIKFEKDISAVQPGIKGDNIIEKLRAQLPSLQMDTMVSSKEKFINRLEEQKKFCPFGELLAKFDFEGREMQFYKVSESSPSFDKYLARVQTLALWYIDAAQYTDNDDPRWNHYFIYETTKSVEGDGMRYTLAGYCSIVNFYCYPEMIRPRIAQILVLPQYRRAGIGVKLLQAVYNDLTPNRRVRDITAEDPADEFIFLRDYVDCCNCSRLQEFAPANLKQGFSAEMKAVALEKLKINPRQSRRVYEILRLMHTKTNDEAEMRDYRIDVKRRLELPFKKSDRDWKRVAGALGKVELASVAAGHANTEQKMNTLQQLFEKEIESYKKTIDRIKTFSSIY